MAAAALGALTASGIAGDGAPSRLVIDPDRDLSPVLVKPGGAGARDRARAAGDDQQVAFLETPDPLEVPPLTEEAATLPCPKGFRAIDGYFATSRAGTFLDLSYPQISSPPGSVPEPGSKPSKRNWVLGVYNSSPDIPEQVILGVVCMNKLK